jgi:hypothetical protein
MTRSARPRTWKLSTRGLAVLGAAAVAVAFGAVPSMASPTVHSGLKAAAAATPQIRAAATRVTAAHASAVRASVLAKAAPRVTEGPGFVSDPARLLDTRTDAPTGPVSGLVQVTVAGTTFVPTGATVELTVNAVGPGAMGVISVYPDGSSAPITSNLNFRPGITKSNTVVVAVPGSGKIDLDVQNAATNVLVDQQGFFTAATLTGTTPTRIGDTRNGTGFGGTPGATTGNVTLTLPSAETSAPVVALNVTAVPAGTGLGHITAFGSTPEPQTSSLNYSVGEDEANLVFVKPSSTGTVTFSISGEPANVVVDLDAYAPAGSTFAATLTERLGDSRVPSGGFPKGPLGGAVTVTLPTLPTGTTSVILNVTVTGQTAVGYTSAYPYGSASPGTSELQYPSSGPIAQAVVVGVGTGNKVTVYIQGNAQLIVDLDGTVGPDSSED